MNGTHHTQTRTVMAVLPKDVQTMLDVGSRHTPVCSVTCQGDFFVR